MKNALANGYKGMSSRHKIVHQTCIYFLYDEEELVYVGKSTRGICRVYEHVGLKQFTHYAFQYCDEEYMDELEQAYIAIYKPKYNLVIPVKNHDWSYAAMTHENYHQFNTSELLKPRGQVNKTT